MSWYKKSSAAYEWIKKDRTDHFWIGSVTAWNPLQCLNTKQGLVAWLSGKTSVSGRRTSLVLCSTCSQWLNTAVGIPSATGQPTRPTQPFILSGLIMSSEMESDVCYCVHVVPSGESYGGNCRPGGK